MNFAAFKLSFFQLLHSHRASRYRVCAISKLVSYFKECIIVTVLAVEFGHLGTIPCNIRRRVAKLTMPHILSKICNTIPEFSHGTAWRWRYIVAKTCCCVVQRSQ